MALLQHALRSAALGALKALPESRARALEVLEPATVEALLPFAERNRIAPIVAHALIERAPALRRTQWGDIHNRSAARMDVLLEETDRVAARLSREGITVVALKNAGIARGIYPCRGCCPMGDVDLLVERARFREAHALMSECGFSLASRSTVEPADLEHGLVAGGTEYVKHVGPEEVWFELQWRPIAGRWIRKDQEPDGPALVGRSVEVKGTDVRVLAPADNMLQVALHTAKHSFVRAPGLRLHTDVDRLVAFAPPPWDEVVSAATRLETKTAVYFSLECARALLGTEIPEHVLSALSPSRWKRSLVMNWLRRVDFFEPDARKFSRPAMMAFHALLYDDAGGLAASAMGADRAQLGIRHLPGNLARATRRVFDLATRYER